MVKKNWLSTKFLKSSFKEVPNPFSEIIQRGEVLKTTKPYGAAPREFPGNAAEWAILWALTKLQIQFYFDPKLEAGSFHVRVDFFLPKYLLVLRILEKTALPTIIGSLEFARIALESQGYRVVDIMADKALKAPMEEVRRALKT